MPAVHQPTKRQAIKRQVVRWIREQDLSPGDRILSQNQLATMFKVTAVTVHKALTELAEEGVVYREQGSGTFVGQGAIRQAHRSICLMLPAPHLDEPAYNPVYWPEIQTLYRAFLQAVGQAWTFSTRVVAPTLSPDEVEHQLEACDAVFFHHSREPRHLFGYLVQSGRARVVSFGRPDPANPCLTVDHDCAASCGVAIDHLFARGYRRPALLACRHSWGDEWVHGYREALAAHGAAVDPTLIVRTGESTDDGFDATRDLIATGTPFDSIFADSDVRALGAVHALQEAGIDVPGEIGVVGYYGYETATRQPPYLTSVRIPYEQMIGQALKLLDDHPGQPLPVRHVAFTGHIVPGRTTR